MASGPLLKYTLRYETSLHCLWLLDNRKNHYMLTMVMTNYFTTIVQYQLHKFKFLLLHVCIQFTLKINNN